MRVLIAAAAAVIAVTAAAQAASISVIDDRTQFLQGDPYDSFGQNDFGTYGQSFTVDTASVLTGFGFEILQDSDPFSAVEYEVHIVEWDSSTRTAGTVRESYSNQTTPTPGAEKETVLDFLANVMLEAGEYAILFKSTSGGPALWGAVDCTVKTCYDGGQLLYTSAFNATNGDDSAFFASRNLDSAFYIELQAVPVGAALPLLATGLLGFGALRLSRRRN